MDNAHSLGLVSYDIGSGAVLPAPLVLENSLSSTDNSDVFEFELDQKNGLFLDYTSNGDFVVNFYDASENLIKSSSLSASPGSKAQRFFNFESGSYFLEFKSEQNEQIDYTAELSFGLSDVEVANYASSGAWNAELRTDLGIATANAEINQEGYLIWQNGHSDHHQWLSDSFEFEVLAPTSVKVSYDAVQNPAWINLHIDDVIEQSNTSGSDTVSIDLLPGVHTVRLSGDGKDGAPTKYNLDLEFYDISKSSTLDGFMQLISNTTGLGTQNILRSEKFLETLANAEDQLIWNFSGTKDFGLFLKIQTDEDISIRAVDQSGFTIK